MIDKIPFGKTGHRSSRLIFGAAALGAMKQDKADEVLALLLEFGINHIDTAASYGDSELRIRTLDARASARMFSSRPRPASELIQVRATAYI